ncbi:methylated-DNA--[protein]-cysteine S-methyltransferase [Microlunatus soli]|uniref:Methylated-DNA--protein-cysteine methyltransferase n=1 Tax=Microlunatus soli TaxID=630515 RepID=A0A1H1XZI9_9ACTN|nr:methylated-DNA--[protein]-cysteine S-methyltransferase [Microlunatus soli]SDT14603.1 methylated-DNA-[protein]-cysteine S-methyltransferase [Microlunatus soli]
MNTAAERSTLTEQLPIDPAQLAALHERLVARADHDSLIAIAYRTIDTPVGGLLLAATEQGLVRVAYQQEGFDTVLDALSTKISPRILAAPQRLDVVARELDEYFAGDRHSFDVPLDLSLSTGFRQTVQRYLPKIDYGRTQTYQQVAERVGNPKAVRAVGTACATNPLPVVVPCHRVLRTDGTLGGYIGGETAKSTLLDLERAA